MTGILLPLMLMIPMLLRHILKDNKSNLFCCNKTSVYPLKHLR